jgi:hypothetical protein
MRIQVAGMDYGNWFLFSGFPGLVPVDPNLFIAKTAILLFPHVVTGTVVLNGKILRDLL